MKWGPVILDLEKEVLTPEEAELVQHPACSGVILFQRNYSSPSQLAALTSHIRQVKPKAIIAVDQEGGRVQRFHGGFTDLPAMPYFAKLYSQKPEQAKNELAKCIKILVQELQACHMTLSFIPVLDIDHGKSAIIHDRNLGEDAASVTALAQVIIEVMHQFRMPVTGKHFPGHGAVKADSHVELPVDYRDWSSIWEEDLAPYRALIHQLDLIMPAHVVYPKHCDLPACFSPFWLQTILRKKLGYQGCIISDDLSMKATDSLGSYSDRAHKVLEAGCDLLLVCNDRAGAIEVLQALENYSQPSESVACLSHFSDQFL